MRTLAAALSDAISAGEGAVLVSVTQALGSTPREEGASMLVTAATTAGTIGGGALEKQAIDEARRMIAETRRAGTLDIPLGPALGQCCGGRVGLSLRMADAGLLADIAAEEAKRREAQPMAVIFGAGHTGRALARALAPLPIRVRLVDARPETLHDLPEEVETIAAALPEAEVERAAAGAAFLVMTHDHALDFLIGAAALARPDAAYVGMIGSATKREKFRRHLAGEGMEAAIGHLTLPIGGNAVRDKRPEIIAALTAAELVGCLFSGQQEKVTDRFATGVSRCHSALTDQRDNPPRHAAAS